MTLRLSVYTYLHDSSCYRRGVFYSPEVTYGTDGVPRSIHDHGIQRHFSAAVRVAAVPCVKENGKGGGLVAWTGRWENITLSESRDETGVPFYFC